MSERARPRLSEVRKFGCINVERLALTFKTVACLALNDAVGALFQRFGDPMQISAGFCGARFVIDKIILAETQRITFRARRVGWRLFVSRSFDTSPNSGTEGC